jgi:hypothetical protein
MDCPLEIPLLSASFALPIPFHSVNAKRVSSVPPLSFGIAISQALLLEPGRSRNRLQQTPQGIPVRKMRLHGRQKAFRRSSQEI